MHLAKRPQAAENPLCGVLAEGSLSHGAHAAEMATRMWEGSERAAGVNLGLMDDAATRRKASAIKEERGKEDGK